MPLASGPFFVPALHNSCSIAPRRRRGGLPGRWLRSSAACREAPGRLLGSLLPGPGRAGKPAQLLQRRPATPPRWPCRAMAPEFCRGREAPGAPAQLLQDRPATPPRWPCRAMAPEFCRGREAPGLLLPGRLLSGRLLPRVGRRRGACTTPAASARDAAAVALPGDGAGVLPRSGGAGKPAGQPAAARREAPGRLHNSGGGAERLAERATSAGPAGVVPVGRRGVRRRRHGRMDRMPGGEGT